MMEMIHKRMIEFGFARPGGSFVYSLDIPNGDSIEIQLRELWQVCRWGDISKLDDLVYKACEGYMQYLNKPQIETGVKQIESR